MSPRRSGNSVERAQQLLLLRVRTRVSRTPANFAASCDSTARRPRMARSRSSGWPSSGDPVVVEVADVLVGEVVDGVAQIALDPGGAAAWPARRAGCPRSRLARLGVGVPEPELPEALDGLHADRRRPGRRPVVSSARDQISGCLRQSGEMVREDARGAPARAVVGGGQRGQRVRAAASPDGGCRSGAAPRRRCAARACWGRPAA